MLFGKGHTECTGKGVMKGHMSEDMNKEVPRPRREVSHGTVSLP